MTRAEKYEEMDKTISKEKDSKKEISSKGGEEKDKNLKGGGEGFVCSLECKKCTAS